MRIIKGRDHFKHTQVLHFNFPFNSVGLLEGKMNKPEMTSPSWPCQDGEAEKGCLRTGAPHLAGAQPCLQQVIDLGPG